MGHSPRPGRVRPRRPSPRSTITAVASRCYGRWPAPTTSATARREPPTILPRVPRVLRVGPASTAGPSASRCHARGRCLRGSRLRRPLHGAPERQDRGRCEIRGRRQPASRRGAPPGLVGRAPPLREPPATEFNRFRAIRGRDGTLVRRDPSIAVALRRGGPSVPARGRAAVLLWPCLGPEAGRAGLRTRAPARVRNPRGPSPEPRTARDTPRETRLELFPEPLPGQPEEELTSVAGHHASEPRRVDARPGQGRRPDRPRPIGHRLDGIPPIRSLPLGTPPRSAPVDRLLQHLEAPRPLRPVRNREAHPARSTGTRSPSAPSAPAAPSRAVAPPGAAAPPGVAPAWFA